jgi:sigma-B regulation protein RsbU (phosphoserine phosphatase)
MLQASLRTQANTIGSVSAILKNVNTLVYRSTAVNQFATFFLARVEEDTLRLSYSNAGHNYPFLIKGNRIELLKNGGPVLGPTPDATYTRGFAKLDPGDILCLYSDGIVEAADSKDREFGLDRLQRIVRANRDRSAREIGSEVLARVTKWGSGVQDDRTVVIVKAVTV